MNTELLIKNARLWPSARSGMMEGGSVLIRNGLIEKIGDFRARVKTVIDAEGCLVMPGFVQSHVHLCQTLFRGVAEDMPLLPWLRDFIWPLEAAHDPDSIHTSAMLACAEMIRGGTTAFLSMESVRHTDATFEAVAQSGLMGVIGHCLMDKTCGFAPLAVDIDDAIADCDLLLEHYGLGENIRLAVAPRFALACSSHNMKKAADYARDRKLLLHTHASEQIEEIELVKKRTGMWNIHFLESVGLTGPDCCLAHCVHTRPDERDVLRETGTKILHCPSANLKLGSGIAPVPEYLGAGICVSLGADGAACNNRLDQFVEMREAGLMQKIRLGPHALPAREIVAMATEGGAYALGWQHEMGTLDAGKRANIIIVDQSDFSVLPSADPATNLVYSNCSRDVVMTIVNGEILFEDGRLTTIDEDKLKSEVHLQRKKLFERAGLA